MKCSRPIKAIIFDNDGVVIDSLQIYRSVGKEILGYDFPFSLIKKITGRSDKDICRIVVEELKLPMTVEEFAQKRRELLLKMLPNSTLIPGAEAIVKKMKSLNLPLALATSGDRPGQEAKAINHQDLYSLFDVIICGDEVQQAKPSPEIFLKAAEMLGNIPPENVIVIEDSLNGIIAANKANMVPILLKKGEVHHEDPLTRPFMQIESFDEFDYNLFDFQP